MKNCALPVTLSVGTFIFVLYVAVAYPGILFGGGSTNSVEDRGHREWGSGGGSPLVRGFAQFVIRFDFVKLSGCLGLLRMFSTELGIRLSFVKTSEFRGGGGV
jgi:hypothetical protein